MCASFRNQGIKPQLLLLPPELLPPKLLPHSFILELSSLFKMMFNMGGCLKTRLLQQKILIGD